MEENNLPKIEIKADISKPIENAYDDALKQPLISSSGIVCTMLDFFHNTVLCPLQKYNLYAKNKLESYAKELQEKAQTIPEKNLVSPRVNILGPTIEGLKYNLDEEYIKEMFENLLIADMDNRKQGRVIPAYIEIVKQLSNSDAKLLKQLFTLFETNIPCIKLKCIKSGKQFEYLSNDLIIHDGNSFSVLNPINIDNLVRLNLISVTFQEFLANKDTYSALFNKVKDSPYLNTLTLPKEPNSLNYIEGILRFTTFGDNFIDICLF